MSRSLFLVLVVLSFFYACANIGSPKGGPIDETPPVLDISESTENYQTNFKKQDIVLVFNEFVELKDVFNQVVVSPPLSKRPKVSKKLKTVRFEFPDGEELKPDATYTINFGEAVRDYTEGNVVPDLRFVFSTGDYIDSLEVQGSIVDALTGDPAKEILLMLYDNLADSVVRTERPFYFAKTGKNGQYKIENVKTGTFKVFALKDNNLNYLYDQDNELIGFPDSTFDLSGTRVSLPPIKVFQELPPLRINNIEQNPGVVKLTFNQKPEDLHVSFEEIGQEVLYAYTEDTLSVWHDLNAPGDWQLFIRKDTILYDTVLVEIEDKADFLNTKKLKRANARKNAVIKVNPTKTLRIEMNHPLKSVDTSRIFLLQDTVLQRVNPEIQLEQREVILKHKWKEAVAYDLRILPAGLTDIFGLSNEDTIRQSYLVSPKKEFGDISLTIDGLDSTVAYVVQLYFKNGNLADELQVSGLETFNYQYKTLPPGEFYVQIITDFNGNGKWDTGNYDRKVQPEPIYTKTLDKLRANWELDMKISIGKAKNPVNE